MKKRVMMALTLIMITSSTVCVIAATTVPSNSVIYDNTTVDVALDELYTKLDEINKGKSKIAEAITNNGVNTDSSASFTDMATNINTLATNKYNTGYNAGVTATKVGTATASQVLTGYTFTNSSGVGISGTMANKGALNWSPTTSTTYTVPAGYYSGGTLNSSGAYNAGVTATKVGTATASQVLTGYTFTNSSGVGISGTMANKGALNWNPSTSTSYTVPAGYYSGGTISTSNAYTAGYNAGVAATKVGTATAAKVLTGYTFTNSSGVGISGTMANKGTLNWSPTKSTTKTVAAGYYSGGTLDSSGAYDAGYDDGYDDGLADAEESTMSQTNKIKIVAYTASNSVYGVTVPLSYYKKQFSKMTIAATNSVIVYSGTSTSGTKLKTLSAGDSATITLSSYSNFYITAKDTGTYSYSTIYFHN